MLTANSQAQDIVISGHITKVGGSPLEGVTVSVILPCKDSTIVSFTSSDQNGQYAVTVKQADRCVDLSLTYSILGYLKKEVSLTVANRQKVTMDVILTPQQISLNEVIIKAKPNGFKQSNDSTQYRISQYVDGTERKLEDILRKLPGMSVSDNGMISFQGKNIDKILVEGDDFFSKNYTVLSKNVSANLVESIEALDNYNDEKLLKGISRSDKVVLNLKLKKDAKATFFGDTEIGVGTDNRYNSSLNIFSFYKKAKVALLGNINNTGDEAVADIQYNLSNNNGNNYSPNEQTFGVRNPFNDKLPVDLDVGKNRYVINKAFTEGLQFNYTFSNKFKANFYSFLNTDNQKLSLSKNTQYLFPDSAYTISERSLYNFKPQTINSNLKLSYQLTDSSTLTYNISSEINSPDFLFNLELYPVASGNQSGLVNGSAFEKNINVNNRIIYTNRVSANKAVIFEGAYLSYKNDLYQKQDTNRFSYLNDIPVTWNIQQNAGIYAQRYEAILKFLATYKNHTYFVSANVDQNTSKLNSYYFGTFDAEITPLQSLNKVSLNDLDLFIEARDVITWKRLELNYGFRAFRNLLNHNLSGSASDHLEAYFFLPKISFKYKSDAYNTFTISYEQNNVSSTVTDIYPNVIISDYLSASKGIGKLNNNLQQDLSFRYRYSNSNNQWIMNFTSSLHLEKSPYITETSIYNQLLVNTYLPGIAGSYFFYNRFQSDKYIRLLQSNWRVVVSKTRMKINSIINNEALQSNILNTISASTAINTAFDIPVNFQAGAAYNNSSLTLKTGKVVNNLFKYDISANLKFLEFFNLKIIGNNYRWSSTGTNTSANFLDMKLGYRNPKQKWALGISGKNILNAKTIAFNESDNFILSQNLFQLLQRYFLVSLNYTF
ncbi:CarboxypepD_reg-like domain-containing protein [Mucilaginibacter pineti]|uniref:CarboxypepD_reg-like domain-containing protein n=1 Tax=Mucilaginibacter pineti TaxID=1391627 RepID=A0A1G7LAI6_9SPHI|nr:CarboxypepD_reg-like domain-containing protein [Mucilaginibacter pineti]